MKKVILLCGLAAATTVAKAQGTLAKGDAQLNAGVGLSGWGVPLYVGVDFGVWKNITVGVEGSFRSYSNIGYTFSIIGVLGNANYHFNELLELPSKWDVYAGLNLGYFIYNTPNGYTGPGLSTLGVSGQVGARYFLSKTVGLNLEAGGGSAVSGLKFGVTVKL